MKVDDVLNMLESDHVDARQARWKAAYFDLHVLDEKQYQQNRRSKRDYDDESDDVYSHKRRFAKHNRSKRQ